jgi:Family of unknown function (DUF6152)
MKIRYHACLSTALTAAAMLAVSGAASAHHSFAMYDLSIDKTLTGQLTRFIIGANHSQLIFDLVGPDGQPVTGDDGKPVSWGVETTSARRLADMGITVKSFKVGTIMTVKLHPLRDGRNFGALRDDDGLLIACGTSMPAGGCNEKTGEVYIGGQ